MDCIFHRFLFDSTHLLRSQQLNGVGDLFVALVPEVTDLLVYILLQQREFLTDDGVGGKVLVHEVLVRRVEMLPEQQVNVDGLGIEEQDGEEGGREDVLPPFRLGYGQLRGVDFLRHVGLGQTESLSHEFESSSDFLHGNDINVINHLEQR